ncbi:hypothetical protein E0H86_15720 [Acinetobacter sp. ANC 4635]|uniref:hypothetical protein n=1 Tax=Acinetobacter sp. ANC 4635 TaxID=2529846 RepID=UPI00103EA9A3|nr:hypothetical protein [Acinetobacter sp. ANC 4635]TCB23568.1 hypothetical protein E0H86_15720 [Acinetobacter sp. ANC 4635]
MKNMIAVLLLFFSFVSFSHAALTTKQLRNQDEYAAAMSKQMRNYDSMEAKVNYNNLKNQINGSMSAAKTLSDGSRAASASSISKAVDAARAAGTIGGRFAKASVPAFVGSMALDGLIKGIGWVMDDGSKAIQKPVTACSYNDSSCSALPYYYPLTFSSDIYPVSYCYSATDCAAAATARSDATNSNGIGNVNNKIRYDSCAASGTNFVCSGVNIKYGNSVSLTIYRTTNPSYSSVPTYAPVSQQELVNAIQQYLQQNPNSDITNNIYVSAYSPDMQFALDDAVNVLASEMADGMAQSLDEAAKSATGNASVTIYNPVGDIIVGSATSQIDLYGTGSTTTTAETSTTTNADGTTSTTTTQGTQQSDWSALCDYAAKFCDWMDWTKQEPDLQDSQLDIQDKTIDDYAYADHVVFGKTCPFQTPETVTLNLGIIGQITFQKDLTFMCTFADSARPYVIGLGYLGSFLYLLIALRNRNV